MSLSATANPSRSPLGRSRARRVSSGGMGLAILVLITAGVMSIPVLVVLGHVVAPTGEIWGHLASTVLPRYVRDTLLLMLGVGVGVSLIGVCSAWMVTMWRFPGVGAFEWLLLLPLSMPAYVIAYAYTGLLDYAGPVQTGLRAAFGWTTARDYWFPEIRSLSGAVAMMSLVLYPYVYMLARAAFLEQSVCALEASRVLGCGPWRSFFKVALPLARPAIVAGVSLALMESMNDIGTVQFFAVDTFTTGIYRTWMGLGEPVAAGQLGAVLLLVVFALMSLERFSRGKGGTQPATARFRQLPRLTMKGWRAALAVVGCAIPVTFGFVLPAILLMSWGVRSGGAGIDAHFFTLAGNSFLLASCAALMAVGVAVVLAYGRRLSPLPLVKAAVRVASLGYATPGAVIAVGAMVPLTALDHALNGWIESATGVAPGLLLTGSVAGLLFVYLVRFLAVSLNSVEGSLARITSSLEGAARTLGHGPWATLRRVHLPILRGSLLTAGLLVFVDVMKELPATLIMRPFNFDTLAVRTFELASDERLTEAAPAALTIVAVGILPVILLSRSIARSRPGSTCEGGAA